MVQMFVRTVVRMRVIVSYSLLFISISLNIFFVRILVSCLTLFFPVVVTSLFLFSLPFAVLRHADRMALFQRFIVVCFLDLIISSWVYILEPSTG